MEFVNRLTRSNNLPQIISELSLGLEGIFDVGVMFVTPGDLYNPLELLRALREKVYVRHWMGITCAGLIGSHKEIEGVPSACLMLMRLPKVHIVPFILNQRVLESLKDKSDWYNFFEVYPTENPVFLVFADPFSIDTNAFLKGLNSAYQGRPVIGGLASVPPPFPTGSLPQTGGSQLIMEEQIVQEGAVGICLTGPLYVQTVVSQGCRPIGKTFIVTKAQRNIVYELAGRPFYQVLEEVLRNSTDHDRQLASQACFLGIAMNEYKHEFKRGDFLIRGLLAVEPQSGAGVIGDHMHTGQTVQFHVRDAKTAHEDLHEMLKLYKTRLPPQKAAGALVFSCNGRGINLFREPDHDIKIIQHYLGPLQAAGFFCAGEFGPVGGINFLHGFTNSTALFYPP